MPSYRIVKATGTKAPNIEVEMLAPTIFYLRVGGNGFTHGEPNRSDIKAPAIVVYNADNPGAIEVGVSDIWGTVTSRTALGNNNMVVIPLETAGTSVAIVIDRGGRVTAKKRYQTFVITPPRLGLPLP